MDLDEIRSILRKSGVDVWTLIDSAISVASLDYRNELKDRRDGIVERLYEPISSLCRNCDLESLNLGKEIKEKESSSHEGKGGSPSTPQSIDGDEDRDRTYERSVDEDRDRTYERSVDEEQTKILTIKDHLEDLDQSEDSLVHLLQNLADMDITFKALKKTDIGRHVNRLRKHSSSEVRRLVKQLVRKWKDLVDEWVKLNTSGDIGASALIATDGDSPQQNPTKSAQNGHHQVPDFTYSPNTYNGSSGSDKNNSESEPKGKGIPIREPQNKPMQSLTASASASTPPPPNKRREEHSTIDPERLASARKRLHENYQEAQNAKKQRTVQVMDLHDIPKPKNSFFGRNKGGFQAKHW